MRKNFYYQSPDLTGGKQIFYMPNPGEKFPDILPDTTTMFKKWVWKEESNILEQISTGVQQNKEKHLIAYNKSKAAPGITATSKSKAIQSQSLLNQTKSKNNNQISGKNNLFSPKPSVKLNTSVKRLISLDDVKGVALDVLIENGEVSESFQENLQKNSIDGILYCLLVYFDVYFEKDILENKPKVMLAGQSMAEKKAIEDIVKKLSNVQKKLSEQYCSLVLGLDGANQHHLNCGKQRKSQTKKDRYFYENFYLFCCQVIWITFRRSNFDLIQKELGRLFRSDTFNPYGRPQDKNEFRLASDLTHEEINNIKLASLCTKKNKRPPIQSIINQRSPVLVALLPNSKDSSEWLFDRRNALPINQNMSNKTKADQLVLRHSGIDTQVGIIGEMICGFNPFTLAPFGEEEEEEEEEEEDRQHVDDEKEGKKPSTITFESAT